MLGRIMLIVGALLAGTVLIGLIAFQSGRYPAPSPHDGTLALTGARLVDGTHGEPLANATILVRNERIQAVGPASNVEIPDNAKVRDLAGMTVLPGLIDSHVHFGVPEAPSYEAYQNVSIPSIIWRTARMFPSHRRAFIQNGVTSIKSVGDVYPWIVNVKRSIANANLGGPRVFAAGPVFTAPGGHPVSTIYQGNDYLIENAARQVDDPKRARQEVQALAQGGVDFIKAIYEAGGPQNELPRLDPQVLKAIIDEAHAQGLKVTVHTSTPSEVRDVVELGADGIEHGVTNGESLSEETIQLLSERNVAYDPTLSVIEAQVELTDRPTEVLKEAQATVKALDQAGVTIVAGTDVGNPGLKFGPSLHRELELLVESGMTSKEAIQAATRNAARWLEGDDLGTVEPRKLADLTIVAGNPLDDIAQTRQVRMVIKDGTVVFDQLTD
ncbi:MAG: amidohydrolase family protein [Candidatus Bipolaricaulia bacterium]